MKQITRLNSLSRVRSPWPQYAKSFNDLAVCKTLRSSNSMIFKIFFRSLDWFIESTSSKPPMNSLRRSKTKRFRTRTSKPTSSTAQVSTATWATTKASATPSLCQIWSPNSSRSSSRTQRPGLKIRPSCRLSGKTARPQFGKILFWQSISQLLLSKRSFIKYDLLTFFSES